MMIPTQTHAAKINKKYLTLLAGKTSTLKVTGTSKKVEWKTKNKKIVKILSKTRKTAQIRAMKVGTTTITAKVGKRTYKCKIQVVNPKLSKSTMSLKAGSQAVLSVTGGTGKIVWKSNNSGVAKVENSKVIAVKAGKATITATQNGKIMNCTVTVSEIADGKKWVKKTRWVVTKEARTVNKAIYKRVGYIECLICHDIFQGENMGEEYDAHESEHGQKGEGGQYTVKSWDTIIGWEVTEYPEEGYFEDYWVYE